MMPPVGQLRLHLSNRLGLGTSSSCRSPNVTTRVEDPVVLWERDGRLTSALQRGMPAYPQPDLQWIEDRIWVWVHYAATKIACELRETIAEADARSCAAALRRCIEIYRKLRGAAGTVRITGAAERASVEYLSDVERRLP